MNKLYFIVPIVIFVIAMMITFYQVDKIKKIVILGNTIDMENKKMNHEVHVYEQELEAIQGKKENLNSQLEKIKAIFRMKTSRYSQNKLRNEVDGRAQKYGIIIEEFSLDNRIGPDKKGLQTDTIKMQLFGYYSDFIRFMYKLTEKFGNLDVLSISISRENIYQEKVKVLLRGHLYKYVQ